MAGLDASNEDIFNYVNNSGDLSFVLNERGEILFWSSTVEKEFFTEAARKVVAGESGVVPLTLNDKDFYLAFASMKDIGWSFGMMVSEDEVLQSTRTTHDYFLAQIKSLQEKMTGEYSFMNTLSIVIPVALLVALFLMSTNLSRRFVKPINELSDSVREISGGNLDKKIDVHTGDEIEHLAICFNAMTDELKRYMANLEKETAEKERIATELDVAKDIQNGMLPKDFPTRADFELFATMTPAKGPLKKSAAISTTFIFWTKLTWR